MKFPLLLATAALMISAAAPAAPHRAKPHAAHPPRTEAASKKAAAKEPVKEYFKPAETRSAGTVIVGGQPINYDAIAGTLVVHAKGWEDTDALDADTSSDKSDKDKSGPKPEASMFYVAYFKQGAPAAKRPITFLFNGGPGSSSIWLHMGAFGPVRVQTLDAPHYAAGALYRRSTTTRACSTPATSCSSTRRARASAASPARTRRRRSTASTRTSTPSPISSRNS